MGVHVVLQVEVASVHGLREPKRHRHMTLQNVNTLNTPRWRHQQAISTAYGLQCNEWRQHGDSCDDLAQSTVGTARSATSTGLGTVLCVLYCMGIVRHWKKSIRLDVHESVARHKCGECATGSTAEPVIQCCCCYCLCDAWVVMLRQCMCACQLCAPYATFV